MEQKNFKKCQHRPACPRGCGKDYLIRGDALCLRCNTKSRPGRSSGYFSGYGYPRTSEGHHDLFQTGENGLGRYGDHPFGYAGACGFLRRDGEDAAGTGLCGAGGQWDGWCPGAYRDTVETPGALSDPCFFICK